MDQIDSPWQTAACESEVRFSHCAEFKIRHMKPKANTAAINKTRFVVVVLRFSAQCATD